MNRKERRKAQKDLKMGEKINNAPMNVLAPSTPINTLITRQIDKVMDQERLKASNDTLNLIVSILTVVLKELQDFSTERIEEVLKQMIEQMDLCGQQLVTTDEMMALAESYGIKTYIDEDAMSEIGRKMHRKIAAFEYLDAGVVEIEELANKANITAREAMAFRWEYNTKKYGVVDMTVREKVFKCFDDGMRDVELIAKEAGTTKGSVYQYKSTWKADKLKNMDPEEFASMLLDSNKQENEPQEEIMYKDVEIQAEKEEPVTEPIKAQIERVEQSNQVEEVKKDKAQEDAYVEVQVVEEVKESVQVIKKGFKSKKKTIELEGDFTTYKIENKVVEFWNMSFEKQHLLSLIEELQAVAEEF